MMVTPLTKAKLLGVEAAIDVCITYHVVMVAASTLMLVEGL